MNLVFTSTPFPNAGRPLWCPELMADRYRRLPHPQHVLVDDAEVADAILFFEPSRNDEQEEVLRSTLRAHPWVERYPHKTFLVDSTEKPLGWLPGVYTSMPRERFDRTRFRAMGYLVSTNPLVSEHAYESDREPRRLACFWGARMPGVRTALLNHEGWPADFEVVATEFQGNWLRCESDADKRRQERYRSAYINAVLDSRFVLCPDGYATSTFRMYEAMELGRVPVVLADQWVAPSGPDWDACTLRVAEADWSSLPSLLGAAEHRWPDMASCARETWERWFSPEAHVARILEWLVELMAGPRPDERELRKRWPKQEFIARRMLEGRTWRRRVSSAAAGRSDLRSV